MNKRASVLAIALWSLCLLTLFSVNLAYGVRQKVLMVQRLDQRDKLRFIAEAGVKRAILELRKKDTTPGYDALSEGWSNNRMLFDKVKIGEGSYSVLQEFKFMESSFSQVRYGTVDEESKINLNTAKRAVIEKLLKFAADLGETKAQNISAAIVDWRDRDSELSTPLGSAEDGYYRDLRHPYECKDEPFTTLNELFLVKEMTKEIFDNIKEYVTIYGEGTVNINTASDKVLESLGLQKTVVDKILYYRWGSDSLEGTADDFIFILLSEVINNLTEVVSLGEGEVANLSNAISQGKLSTASSVFTIKSIGALNGKDATLAIECVFERPEPEPDPETGILDTKGSILYWQE